MGTGLDEPICTPNQTHLQSSASLKVWNVTTEREVHTKLGELYAKYPEFSEAIAFHEGYSTKAVTEVDSSASAVPYRDYSLLT